LISTRVPSAFLHARRRQMSSLQDIEAAKARRLAKDQR
jgi:hypothetical protein